MKKKGLFIIIIAFILVLGVAACDRAENRMGVGSAEDILDSLIMVNNLAETLSILDTQGKIHNNVQLTGSSPNAIVHDPPYIYVVNSLSNSLEVLSDIDLSIIGEISVGAGRNPMQAALIQKRMLAVTSFLTGCLDIVDIDTKKVARSIDLSGIELPRDVPEIRGKSYPYGVTVNAGKIFVTLANLTDHYGGLTAAGPGVVAVIDAQDFKIIGTIVLEGADPVFAQAYGSRVIIACAGHYEGDITKPQSSGFRADGTIEIIETDSMQLSKSYDLKAAPFSFSISEDAILYASNAMGAQIPKINLASDEITFLNLGGAYISSVLVVGNTLYVLDFSSDQLFALNSQGDIQAQYTVGDGPLAMLSLSDITVEGTIIPKLNVNPLIASPGIEINFDASPSLVPDGVYIYSWDFGDGQSDTGKTVKHAYLAEGEYTATLTIKGEKGEERSQCLVKVVSASPFATQMIDYTPAPGQFIHNPQYNDPNKALGPPVGGTPLQPDNSSVVSLGGFGGSIILAFDHEVNDNPGAPDFIVFGNAQYDRAPLRFIEPGMVEISADGDTWYLIPGSSLVSFFGQPTYRKVEKYYPETDQTYSTYQLPSTIRDDIENNQYLIWGYADLSPVLALPQGADITQFYNNPDNPLSIGIDPDTCGGDAFDIAWAVDPVTGESAHLTGFKFIKISTAVDGILGGSLGEFSTEVDAVSDIDLK
jgi:DNA-binding beta-propeller fold protein YncE